jgi:regulator of cell morphogenesis and NO signaling
MEEVADATQTPAEDPAEAKDWNHLPLGELIGYVEKGHHAWMSEELIVIAQLLDRASELSPAGVTPHASLAPLQRVFGYLRAELESHMRKEEMILFPAIAAMERSPAGGPAPAVSAGSIVNVVATMEQEHEVAVQYLDEIRDLTYGYDPPENASQNLRALYRELQVLEADLRTHIHLENNILFPRAIRLEEETTNPAKDQPGPHRSAARSAAR